MAVAMQSVTLVHVPRSYSGSCICTPKGIQRVWIDQESIHQDDDEDRKVLLATCTASIDRRL